MKYGEKIYKVKDAGEVKLTHPLEVTVWYGVYRGKVGGPYCY